MVAPASGRCEPGLHYPRSVYSLASIVYTLCVEPPGPGPRPTSPDETYIRRVCAILLGDVFGYSALMGEDDERTARAIHALQAAIHDIVADAKGRADPFAGDAILATFDSVVNAVETALAIQRRVAEQEFAGTRLQMRIGVHFGDVLERDGAAFGDAINIAARLQTLAKPGTICISEGVYRQVRNRFNEQFVDLGRQQLKNISDPVHAYLIVPRDMVTVRASRRSWARLAVGAAAVAALALVSGVAAVRYWSAPPAQPTEKRSPLGIPTRQGEAGAPAAQKAAAPAEEGGQVTLGVMLFKSLAPEGDKDWRREALRDGLNAQLSQLSQVKVYSKEFIDFLISRKGLTDIEAATQLGIKKMLSGSFVVVGDTLRIETHVVDVTSGVLEASYTTAGRDQDFLDLQQKMALGVISHLNLPVTDDERRTLLAEQPSTNVEALKMLLEAESGGGARRQAPGSGGAKDSPSSSLPYWLASFDPARAASADDAGGAQAAILDVLEQYRKATEAREMQSLAAVYDALPPEQQAAQQRYFENVRDLKVAIDHVDVAVVGDEAVASYTRTDDFVDARTGRPMHVTVRLTKILRRSDGMWKLAGGK